MNKKRDTYLQRMAAAILMAVFVFIHVVKLVHHHDYSSATHHALPCDKASVKAPDCSICDYHFVKDGSSTVTFFALPSLSLSSITYTDYLFTHLTSIGLSSSDRGPPSLA